MDDRGCVALLAFNTHANSCCCCGGGAHATHTITHHPHPLVVMAVVVLGILRVFAPNYSTCCNRTAAAAGFGGRQAILGSRKEGR